MHKTSYPMGTTDRQNMASGLLDLLRFLAALTVVLYHTASFANLTSPSLTMARPIKWLIIHALYLWTTLGYQAVMVFFVLSGYLISSNVLRSMVAGTWSWKIYAIHRLTRLYTVLIPALVLTLIFAKIQVHLFGPIWYFKNSLSWKVFLGNMAFLQDIKVGEFGGNGPLWSLSFEFWYYVMFPLMALVFYARKAVYKISCAVSLGVLAYLLGWDVARYFLVWLLGAGTFLLQQVNLLPEARKITRYLVVLVASAFAIWSLFVPYHMADVTWPTYTSPNPQFLPDLCVGLAFSLLIYIMTSLYRHHSNIRFTRLCAYLGGFSYTIYLVHYPLLHIMFAWLTSPRWPLPFRSFTFIGPIAIVGSLIYAWIVSRIFESRTAVIRSVILRTLRLKQPSLIQKLYQ